MIAAGLLDAADRLEAVQAGHERVQEDQIRWLGPDEEERLGAGAGLDDVQAPVLDRQAQQDQVVFVVVDYEDPGHELPLSGARGTRLRNP